MLPITLAGELSYFIGGAASSHVRRGLV